LKCGERLLDLKLEHLLLGFSGFEDALLHFTVRNGEQRLLSGVPHQSVPWYATLRRSRVVIDPVRSPGNLKDGWVMVAAANREMRGRGHNKATITRKQRHETHSHASSWYATWLSLELGFV
jgi:hypothetical protein